MSLELKYPQWQGHLEAAILEFDPEQLGGKLQNAQQAIASRLEELACGKSNEHELRAFYYPRLETRPPQLPSPEDE